MTSRKFKLAWPDGLVGKLDRIREARGFPSRSAYLRYLFEGSLDQRRTAGPRSPTAEDLVDVKRGVLRVTRAEAMETSLDPHNTADPRNVMMGAYFDLSLVLQELRDWWEMPEVAPLFMTLQPTLSPDRMHRRMKLIGAGLHQSVRWGGSIAGRVDLVRYVARSGILDGGWKCEEFEGRDRARQAATEALHYAVDQEGCLLPLAREYILKGLSALSPNDARQAWIAPRLGQLCDRHRAEVRQMIRGLAKRTNDPARKEFLRAVHDTI